MYRTDEGGGRFQPELSIIVPVHNGAGTLRACLDALLRAPGPARELTVIDDESRDDSAAIAVSMGVRTIRCAHNRGCGAARNSGEKETTGPILVFVDSDVVIQPDTLQRISKFMSENPGYSAVLAPMTPCQATRDLSANTAIFFTISPINRASLKPRRFGPISVPFADRLFEASVGFDPAAVQLPTSHSASICPMPDFASACIATSYAST